MHKQCAQQTMRRNTDYTMILNPNNKGKHNSIYNRNKDKQTIRPLISHNCILNTMPNNKSSYIQLTNTARYTIKKQLYVQSIIQICVQSRKVKQILLMILNELLLLIIIATV